MAGAGPSRVAVGFAAGVVVAMVLAQGAMIAAPAGGSAASAAGAELLFVPNVGQIGAAARFVAHTAAGAILLAPGEVDLAPRAGGADAGLRIEFAGCNQGSTLVGSQPRESRVNYLVGADPSRWHRDVPTYGGVTYRDLYAGIDLDLAGSGGLLKGTYRVAPGADPGTIRWRYAGSTSLRLAPSGELDVALSGRRISEAAPVAWQEVGGRRHPVEVSYSVAGDGAVGFAAGEFDRTLPLVIDPYLVYSTLIGGSDLDDGRDLDVDAAGNVYITGTTRSRDLPGAGAPDASYNGPTPTSGFGDAFIAKLNPAGSALVYMTYLGGANEDIADAITVDGSGNAYVTGMTRSSDFPTVNAVQPVPGGSSCGAPPCSDAFVAKLNASGDSLVFATYLGGSGNENSSLIDVGTRSSKLGIALDDAANIYVTGVTESDDFPVVGGAFTARAGLSDVFLTKLRADGQAILYSTYLGGGGVDLSGGVGVDAFARAYVTGTTFSSDFPVEGGVQGSAAGSADVFVTAIDPSQSGADSLLYSTYLGGSDADYGMSIAVDGDGNATIAGYTQSLDFPTVNAFQPTSGSAARPTLHDAFVARLNAPGSLLLYSSYLGGADDDAAYGVRLDASGHAFVTGRTYSDDFPVLNPWQAQRNASSDIFVAAIDPSRSGTVSLLFGTYVGGPAADVAYGIAVDAADAAYVVGHTSGTTASLFPIYTTIGPNGNDQGVVVAKLDPGLQYWIPVVSHAAGAKNSQWRTDLGIENGNANLASLTLSVTVSGKTRSLSSAVARGNQAILTDVAGQLGYTGNAALQVLSDRPVRLSSRTYNLVASDASCYAGGTFGQNYDVAVTHEGLASGESAWLTQLVETSSYRTNIVVTNTGRSTATVIVSLYDGAGTLLTSFQLSVAAGGVTVDSQPFLKRANKSNLQRAYARVWVSAGYGVIASASVIDNLTNDPTTIAMVPSGSEQTETWVPVSSHLSGSNNSQWRTGLGLLNPSTLAANVTLRFRSGGKVSANTTQVAPASQSILDDVIGGIPASGNGSLEVTADQSVIVTSRTYNQIAAAATCFPGGTLGQSYPSYTADNGLAAGETAWLVQLTETVAYRTNISLTNTGATAASVTITLFDWSGLALTSYSVSLAAGEMKQDNRPFFARAGKSNMPAGYARVVVNSGSGVVPLASVVDNVTNDPMTISPLP
jgi:hypothetical protein